MGVDSRVWFPAGTDIERVGMATGILAGLRRNEQPHESSGRLYSFVRVPGVSYRTHDDMPGFVTIELRGTMADGQEGHTAYWHFQSSRTGQPRLTLTATPFWGAIAMRLVETFGGTLDVYDTDDNDADVVRPKPRGVRWNMDDDDNFERMQDLLRRLEPITMDDMVGMSVVYGMEFPSWSARPEGVALDVYGKVLDSHGTRV